MEYMYAFITGGIICVVGQLLIDGTKLTTPRVLVILVLAGAVLQALNLYQPLVDIAGPGARVPITGFGYSLAKGTIEGAQSGLLGALGGGVEAVSAGLAAAIGFGYLISIIFNPKSIR